MKQLACALLLLAAAGCEKNDPLFCTRNPGATGCADGGLVDEDGNVVDDDAADPDARACFGGGTFEVCLEEGPPTGTVTMPATYSTTSGSTPPCASVPKWMMSGQPDACIVVADSITVSTALTVTGNRPLVLLAATTITINANIDVASHRGGNAGPGAPSTACMTFAAAPGTVNGGAGGAGGSFVTQGGPGGNGDSGNVTGGTPGPVVSAPTLLRAGCTGQYGGTGLGGGGAGSAGEGGGAIYLVAGGSITIGSGLAINASGAGAVAPNGKRGGGGGGGSGGMIVLNAPTINAAGAFLVANGGGGSSGADDNQSGNGDPGDDPVPTMPANPAAGGSGPSSTGDGGDGWALGDTQAGSGTSSTTSQTGGGGGGGGGGYIRTNATSGATSSPAEDVVP